MAQLCTENLSSLTIVARSAWEEEKNVSIFQFLTVYACFRGTQRQFSENICSKDDLRSRIFEIFVVKFRACLHVLGFSNI